MKNVRLITTILAGTALMGAAGVVLAQGAAPTAPAAAGAAAAAPGGGGRGAAGGGGGGGGRGAAATPPAVPVGGPAQGNAGLQGQPTYNDNCSSCHGTGLADARAPSLFTAAFLNSHSNTQIENTIKNGVAGTEMSGFKGQLTDLQVSEVVDYLRRQGLALKPAVPFVANPSGQVVKTQKQTFRIDVVADGLATPWGESFLPDGRLLVTERDGNLRIIDKTGKLLPPVKGTPKPHVQQDGGYLDVAVSPDYATNGGWIYMAYTDEDPTWSPPPPPPPPAPGAAPAGGRLGGGANATRPSMTVIIRGKLNAANEWVDEQLIYRAPYKYYTNSGTHYGTRILFDGKGHIFFSLGERGQMTNAQDLSIPLGKIHRINVDGTIPLDNPYYTRNDTVKSIWSWGHRNPEGLAFNPVDGKLWESEHGPQGGDEINVIEPTKNYGWGVISMGVQGGITARSAPNMEQPITYYTPTVAPSGINFYTGTKYPGWKNSLFVSCLAGQQLRRLEVKGNEIISQEIILDQGTRVRQVITGPDGLLYILVQNPTGGNTTINLAASTPGRVLRLTPVAG